MEAYGSLSPSEICAISASCEASKQDDTRRLCPILFNATDLEFRVRLPEPGMRIARIILEERQLNVDDDAVAGVGHGEDCKGTRY